MDIIFKRFTFLPFVVIFLMGCTADSKKKFVDNQPRRIEILFLGHSQEHHNSKAYFPLLTAALTNEGINITYTENVNDLNTKNLDLYDGLIVYANHESIAPNQEKALLNFVSEGNAFIPIHSASFCFKNAAEYINLVGAQFMEHGTGTFNATIVAKEHPTMLGLEEFSTWDETYVHDKIADDITVLMERVEAEHREPWTWVKKYGKGKVFYTAYGHDERTWNKPEFQQLIKNGILWAVDVNTKKNWEAFSKDIPKLTYEEREGIPNYEKRDPALKYQIPLLPEQSAKLIQVPAGFDLQLFASEPDIINPIAMNWDAKGRLWVIETVDYPNTVRDDKGLGDDKVKILEDTNGDGRADKVTVFAENLNIPTSFVFYDAGIIVSQAPHFLFLKDTNGDDKADVREVIMDGWGVFDTHAGPSNLQNGIDNNIYGVVGYSGFKGNIYGQDLEFNQNMYRFNPHKKIFEVLINTSNNTWGLGITEDNSLFASTANNTHSVFLGIPNKIMAGVTGIPAQGSLKIDGHYDMQPITKNYRQVDVFGGFTAAAGHHFYTARKYPSSYWNKVAFVCEPTGGLVHIATIIKKGAGYMEEDGGNLFASSDEWVSPVEAKVGPDGNVWVADWYNFIIQHNPTPRMDRGGFDAENGKGNAYVNPLRDKSRGRIWRVVPKQSTEEHMFTLDKGDPETLLAALSNENMFWRMTGQRLLIERANTDVLKSLFKLANDSKVDEMGLNPAALHAFWTIAGLVHLQTDIEAYKVIQGGLYHPSGAVRKAAIQILPKNKTTDAAIIDSKVLSDTNPSVLLAALLFVAERPASKKVGKIIYGLSQDERVTKDSWLSKGLYAAASSHADGFMKEYVKANPAFDIDAAISGQRQAMDYNDNNWKTMELPQYIEDAGLDINGVIWFRKNFNVNNSGGSAYVSLGRIDESDVVYINGKQIGVTEKDAQSFRSYKVPKGVLKSNGNTIVVRVEDANGKGGFHGKPEWMHIRSGGKNVGLSGSWKYEVETDFSQSVRNSFGGTSMDDMFAKNYMNNQFVLKKRVETPNEKATLITIKTVKNEMKYNITEFTVQAGKPVELVLDNVDFMQHNIVIVKPGTKEIVGIAADQMAMDSNGVEQDYIPKIEEVLFASALVDPEQKVTLKFIAPSEPGTYPFICTFPGHWQIMQGVMKVMVSN